MSSEAERLRQQLRDKEEVIELVEQEILKIKDRQSEEGAALAEKEALIEEMREVN